jgi:hypothetical protein
MRKADQRAASILDGKAWGSVKAIKGSDVTSIISEVWKRKYPTRNEAAGDTFNFTVINLDGYTPGAQNPLGPGNHPDIPTIDVTPDLVIPPEKVGNDEIQ